MNSQCQWRHTRNYGIRFGEVAGKLKETRIDTIIMPINVHNIHWYIAFVHIGEKVVNLSLRNNIDMRDKTAEDKLLKIARQYQV